VPTFQKLHAECAEQGYLLAIAHGSFHGLGRRRRADAGYVCVPVNYSSLQ